jgi:2-polyprenyl-6-methoxyphenol hydroxylase-like FAD-dependent oxidoreductase
MLYRSIRLHVPSVKLNFAKDVDTDIVIVGAGPVGLLLATKLIKEGVRVQILEKRPNRVDHLSRAIGIHPPSLELFQQVDPELVRELESKSVICRHGWCMGNGKDHIIGSLRIDLCRKPFNYILSCPQSHSEQALENALARAINRTEKNDSQLIKQALVTSIRTLNDYALVEYTKGDQTHQIKCHFIVGCDGKNSLVRQHAGLEFMGRKYVDTFLMGDFTDNTTYGSSAALFLGDNFLVECFPLPNNIRRWVCSTNSYIKEATLEQFCTMVEKRTHYKISDQKNFMLSSYGVQGYVVRKMYDVKSHRIILAGDSAHQCSPLGGQGMNLGWLDAWKLSQTIYDILHRGVDVGKALYEYDEVQRRKALAVIHRAELNMILGRKPALVTLRNTFIRLMLIPFAPLQGLIASYFTMRYLGNISIGKWVGV